MTHLTRIALDRVVGGYVGVVPAAAQGKAMRNIPMIGTAEVERRLASEDANRSEEHTSELQSLMRISYAVFCLKKKTNNNIIHVETQVHHSDNGHQQTNHNDTHI